MTVDLHKISTEKLRGIRESLKFHHGPITSGAFLDRLETLDAEVLAAAFNKMNSAAILQLLDTVILDRERREKPRPKLVYSGPDVAGSHPRLTQGALTELLLLTKNELLIAGYSFDHTESIFEPLAKRLAAHPHIRLSIFMNLNQAMDDQQRSPRQRDQEDIKQEAKEYAKKIWPFQYGSPQFFYDKRLINARDFVSMHAKCLIIDRRHTLIGSANFTERAHVRNVEVGVLLRDDQEISTTLVEHFEGLVRQGEFITLR